MLSAQEMFNIQEMFNKAYLGLKSQGFERCMEDNSLFACSYSNNGKHCAWGWVDTSIDDEMARLNRGTVASLIEDGIGLASELTPYEAEFAYKLQCAHDQGTSPDEMITRLAKVAYTYSLTIPND